MIGLRDIGFINHERVEPLKMAPKVSNDIGNIKFKSLLDEEEEDWFNEGYKKTKKVNRMLYSAVSKVAVNSIRNEIRLKE